MQVGSHVQIFRGPLGGQRGVIVALSGGSAAVQLDGGTYVTVSMTDLESTWT
jgi:hypothetical protein